MALDIDGTLSPWPVPSGPDWHVVPVTIPAADVPTSPFFGGIPGQDETLPTSLRHTVKDWLLRLHAAGAVELAWASLWEHAAEHYAKAHGLPPGLRVLTSTKTHPPRFGHLRNPGAWKASALSHVDPARPLIWLDDIAHPFIAPPTPSSDDPWYEGLDHDTLAAELAADTVAWEHDIKNYGVRRGHSHIELVIAPHERFGLTDDDLATVDTFLARRTKGTS